MSRTVRLKPVALRVALLCCWIGNVAFAMADDSAEKTSGSSLNWLWILVLGAITWWLWGKRASLSSDTFVPRGQAGWTPSYSTDSAFSNTKHTVSFMREQQSPIEKASSAVLADREAFLQAARQYFLSLQAAFDKGDLEPFSDWMVPDMEADLSAQIKERKEPVHPTEILTLNAEIVDEKADTEASWVTVRFFGTLRERLNGEPQPFNDAWCFKQCCLTSNDPWRLASIDPVEA